MKKYKEAVLNAMLASIFCSVFSAVIMFGIYIRLTSNFGVRFFVFGAVVPFIISFVSIFLPLTVYNICISPKIFTKKVRVHNVRA